MLVASGVVGFAVDRALGGALGGDPTRWPLRCLVGIALAYLVLIGGTLVVLPLALALWWARGRVDADEGSRSIGIAALVIAVALASLRPAYPLYWDEFVWLGKARLAARGWSALRDLSLTPGADVIPSGYPLLYP